MLQNFDGVGARVEIFRRSKKCYKYAKKEKKEAIEIRYIITLMFDHSEKFQNWFQLRNSFIQIKNSPNPSL